jgi:hypothetical protein
VLSVPDTIAKNVYFQLRLFNRQNSCNPSGTEIPVVRESRFLGGRSVVLDVPGALNLRRTVRVFNLSQGRDLRFRFKAYLVAEEEAFFEFDGAISAPSGWASVQRFDDGDPFPDMSYGSLKFEITPEDDTVRYWWFVSVADNSTNTVTIITPE